MDGSGETRNREQLQMQKKNCSSFEQKSENPLIVFGCLLKGKCIPMYIFDCLVHKHMKPATTCPHNGLKLLSYAVRSCKSDHMVFLRESCETIIKNHFMRLELARKRFSHCDVCDKFLIVTVMILF